MILTDLTKQFVAAADLILSEIVPNQECVISAYGDHLSDIDPGHLPKSIQPIFQALVAKLEQVSEPADIGIDEADHLATDILYMANVIRSTISKSAI